MAESKGQQRTHKRTYTATMAEEEEQAQPPIAEGGRPAVAGHAYMGGTLDRAGHLRDDEAWVSATAEGPAAWFLVLTRPRMAAAVSRNAQGGTRLRWERRARALDPSAGPGPPLFLGRDASGANAYFAVDADKAEMAVAPGTEFEPNARLLAGVLTEDEACLLAQARSLLSFHREHAFCGRCGKPTAPAEAGWRRVCACGRSSYPRTNPVAIMMVEHPTDPGLALLGRKKAWPAGVFSCLAGFVEAGESLEEAARRETMEEAGVRVGRVRYVSSQPVSFAPARAGGACRVSDCLTPLSRRPRSGLTTATSS